MLVDLPDGDDVVECSPGSAHEGATSIVSWRVFRGAHARAANAFFVHDGGGVAAARRSALAGEIGAEHRRRQGDECVCVCVRGPQRCSAISLGSGRSPTAILNVWAAFAIANHAHWKDKVRQALVQYAHDHDGGPAPLPLPSQTPPLVRPAPLPLAPAIHDDMPPTIAYLTSTPHLRTHDPDSRFRFR